MAASWKVEKDVLIGAQRVIVVRLRATSGREPPNLIRLAFDPTVTAIQVEATLSELARRWERRVARLEPNGVPVGTWEVRARDAVNVVTAALAAKDLYPEDAE